MTENLGAAASSMLGFSKALQPKERLVLIHRVLAASLHHLKRRCMVAGSPWWVMLTVLTDPSRRQARRQHRPPILLRGPGQGSNPEKSSSAEQQALWKKLECSRERIWWERLIWRALHAVVR